MSEFNPVRVLGTSRPYTPIGAKKTVAFTNELSTIADFPEINASKCLQQQSHSLLSQNSLSEVKLPPVSMVSSSPKSASGLSRRRQFRQQQHQHTWDSFPTASYVGSINQEQLLKELDCLLKSYSSRTLEDEEDKKRFLRSVCECVSCMIEVPGSRVALICDALVPLASNLTDFSAISAILISLLRKKTFTDKLPLSRLLLCLASDDKNDVGFLEAKEGLLPAYLSLLGGMCVVKDAETMLNSYGALKLLSYNSDLLCLLCRSGLVDLCVLHLKLLSEANTDTSKLVRNVVFQATFCLRNCLNDSGGLADFERLAGGRLLDQLATRFADSREIACNLARIFSVLSQIDHKGSARAATRKKQASASTVQSIYLITSNHADKRELVVRSAFTLGNIAAAGNDGRLALASHPELGPFLLDLFTDYSKKFLEKGNLERDNLLEDILVKTVRVFANLSVRPETGEEIATDEQLVSCLIDILHRLSEFDESLEEKTNDDSSPGLLLSVISAVCNLSYYPVVFYSDLFVCVRDHMFSADPDIATEAVRAVGNLSRIKSIRQKVSEEKTFERLLRAVATSESDEFKFAAFGIFVNVVTDPGPKVAFVSKGGLGICWAALDNILKSSPPPRNYSLATIICQLLWNVFTELRADKMDIDDDVTELEQVLIHLNYLEKPEIESLDLLEEEEEEEKGAEDPKTASSFTSISLQLLNKMATALEKEIA